jgi:polysaccharide chain length determinant protein (PEP-CTERM system associated)
MEPLNLTQYLDMALRRKWWITIPFLLTLLVGIAYALLVPRVYEAETLILVQPQKVPQDFVRTIVSSDVEDRLRTITQQVTSRTNLERIIKEFELYDKPPESDLLLDEKVELLREKVRIDVARGGRGGNAFTISFQSKDPRKAMQVTNGLASNFISENLKIRESQALGTSAFLSDELETVRKRLVEKEEQLKEYRQRYMGGMPEHLPTNLRMLERLQGMLDQKNKSLIDAENRKLILQEQMSATRVGSRISAEGDVGSRVGGGPALDPAEVSSGELAELKKQLTLLETRYTDNHPDIRRLRKMISELEGAETGSEAGHAGPASEPAKPISTIPEGKETPGSQLAEIQTEIKSLKYEIGKVQEKIASYQQKVEDTPKREQELLSMQRDYENLRELYNSLLNRKLEADIAVSMEKKQKGEQFRVIDPAKIPDRPIKPNLKKIIIMVLFLGLAMGGGLAYLKEMMDTSYTTPEEVEGDLRVPVLLSMPIRYTMEEWRRIKKRQILAVAGVVMGFFISATALVLATKGWNATLEYIKRVLP